MRSRPASPAPSLVGRHGRLHEDLHRRQRVAELVSHAGRHLPDPGQLLGLQHLAFAFSQTVDNGADPVGDLVQDVFNLLQIGLASKVIGPTTSSSRPAALRIGTLSCTSRRLMARASPNPASSPAPEPHTPRQKQTICQTVGKPLILLDGMVGLPLVDVKKIVGGLLDFLDEDIVDQAANPSLSPASRPTVSRSGKQVPLPGGDSPGGPGPSVPFTRRVAPALGLAQVTFGLRPQVGAMALRYLASPPVFRK